MFAGIGFTDVISMLTGITALLVALANRRKVTAEATKEESSTVKNYADTAIVMGDKAEDYFEKLSALRDEFDQYREIKDKQSNQRNLEIRKLENLLAQREEELRHFKTLLKLRDDRLEEVEVATMQVTEKVDGVEKKVDDQLQIISTKIQAITPDQIAKGSK